LGNSVTKYNRTSANLGKRYYNTTLPPFALAVLPTHEIFAVAQLASFHLKNSGNHPNLHSHIKSVRAANKY
jgi:hypothetical protein